MSDSWWNEFSDEKALDSEVISKLLPHRGDMALLNRLYEASDGALLGEVLLSPKAFWVPGHFPTPEKKTDGPFQIGPIFPGVLMVESSAQLGICLWRKTLGEAETESKLMVFKEITKASFKREARPEEKLIIRCTIEKCSLRLMRIAAQGVVIHQDGSTDLAFSCSLAGLTV